MTVELSPMTTPRARAAMQMKVRGVMTLEDAAQYKRATEPGGAAYGLPLLCLVDEGTDIPVEVQKSFADVSDSGEAPVAVVITSAPLRMVINFIVKAGNLSRPRPLKLKFFSEPVSAAAWLDTEVDAGGKPA